ncbi:hypothetical protein Tco_1090100 [Tanacetum coccineum]|uniref:Uncharacterized protein n=1 Tax=Tanacetum coccineum TaxID=301880 RepID=A0ABQ5I5D3_9ASTR
MPDVGAGSGARIPCPLKPCKMADGAIATPTEQALSSKRDAERTLYARVLFAAYVLDARCAGLKTANAKATIKQPTMTMQHSSSFKSLHPAHAGLFSKNMSVRAS